MILVYFKKKGGGVKSESARREIEKKSLFGEPHTMKLENFGVMTNI